MGAQAVGLDHEAQVRPAEVDSEPVQLPPGFSGGLKRALATRVREPSLELEVGEAEGTTIEDDRSPATPGRPAYATRALRSASGLTNPFVSAAYTARSMPEASWRLETSTKVRTTAVAGMPSCAVFR